MTREEAIKMLGYIRHTGNGESEYKNDAQSIALDMAIKALQFDINKWADEHFIELVEKDVWSDAKKALQQESILDKIRAKIEEPLKINKGIHTDSAKAQAIALSWCLEIIDKYIGGEQE